MPSHGPCQVMQGRGAYGGNDRRLFWSKGMRPIALYNREARGCEGAAQWERKRNEWMETQSATKKKASTDGARSKVSKRMK
jgi:hypothetical protein